MLELINAEVPGMAVPPGRQNLSSTELAKPHFAFLLLGLFAERPVAPGMRILSPPVEPSAPPDTGSGAEAVSARAVGDTWDAPPAQPLFAGGRRSVPAADDGPGSLGDAEFIPLYGEFLPRQDQSTGTDLQLTTSRVLQFVEPRTGPQTGAGAGSDAAAAVEVSEIPVRGVPASPTAIQAEAHGASGEIADPQAPVPGNPTRDPGGAQFPAAELAPETRLEKTVYGGLDGEASDAFREAGLTSVSGTGDGPQAAAKAVGLAGSSAVWVFESEAESGGGRDVPVSVSPDARSGRQALEPDALSAPAALDVLQPGRTEGPLPAVQPSGEDGAGSETGHSGTMPERPAEDVIPGSAAPAGAFSRAVETSASESAPSTPRVSHQVRADELVRTAAAHISRAVREAVLVRSGDGVALTVRLTPPDLGTLKVCVRNEAGVLSTELQSASETVRGLLESNLPSLREHLSSAGIEVSRFTVSAGLDFGQLADRRPNAWQPSRSSAARMTTTTGHDPAHLRAAAAQPSAGYVWLA